VRAFIVAAGLALWFFTQALIGSRGAGALGESATASVSGGDVLFHVTQPVNQFLHTNPRWANALLIASSGTIDILGIWLLAVSIFGSTMRPFVGLLIVFALRQISQALCVLPAPEDMIWHSPGWPSLLVTYQVANDFFFSGHTAIAVLGGMELARRKRSGFVALGFAVAMFEIITVILLRAHYSMDVFAGAIAALWAACAADRVGPMLDRAIARC
jgi:PAP2 superfamily C-terminal